MESYIFKTLALRKGQLNIQFYGTVNFSSMVYTVSVALFQLYIQYLFVYLFIFIHVGVLPACLSEYHVSAWCCPQRPKNGIGSPVTRWV